MRSELSKKYSSVFERHRLTDPLVFAHDVHTSGKWRELSSFIVWELQHRLHLFPKNMYLRFTPQEPLTLEAIDGMDCFEVSGSVERFFDLLGLRATACADNWKLLWVRADGAVLGCRYPDDNVLLESDERSTREVQRFPEPIKAIFVSTTTTEFVCVKGAVYRRALEDTHFQEVLTLASSESFFRHNNAMTEACGGALVIGEYGNVWSPNGWKQLPFLYFSFDDGQTWVSSDLLLRQGTNKHVHVVKYSEVLRTLLVADGDNHKRLWMSDSAPSPNSSEMKWKIANRFHIQMGGYTSIVESDGKVFFGTDYQGGTNFIVESTDGKRFTKKVVPDPYRRSPVDNMALRTSRSGTEIWANLPYSSGASRCLLMFSRDSGTTWTRAVEYSRSTHLVWLISSSSAVSTDMYFSIQNLVNNRRAVYKVGDN